MELGYRFSNLKSTKCPKMAFHSQFALHCSSRAAIIIEKRNFLKFWIDIFSRNFLISISDQNSRIFLFPFKLFFWKIFGNYYESVYLYLCLFSPTIALIWGKFGPGPVSAIWISSVNNSCLVTSTADFITSVLVFRFLPSPFYFLLQGPLFCKDVFKNIWFVLPLFNRILNVIIQ